MLVTLMAASVLGYLSWTFVEKPFIQLKGKLDCNVRNAAIKL
jgi:peptidoglycan/LPS O-acetylase OafA/YrhL